MNINHRYSVLFRYCDMDFRQHVRCSLYNFYRNHNVKVLLIGLPEGHSQYVIKSSKRRNVPYLFLSWALNYFLFLKMLKKGATYLLGIWVQFFHLWWEMVNKMFLKGCFLSLLWDISNVSATSLQHTLDWCPVVNSLGLINQLLINRVVWNFEFLSFGFQCNCTCIFHLVLTSGASGENACHFLANILGIHFPYLPRNGVALL